MHYSSIGCVDETTNIRTRAFCGVVKQSMNVAQHTMFINQIVFGSTDERLPLALQKAKEASQRLHGHEDDRENKAVDDDRPETKDFEQQRHACTILSTLNFLKEKALN